MNQNLRTEKEKLELVLITQLLTDFNHRQAGNNSRLQCVMVYPNKNNICNGESKPLASVILAIMNESDRREIPKLELPVAYFSATKIIGKKTDNNVSKHSGLFVLDIDVDKNPDIDFVQLKKELCTDKYTLACFTSPNGGLKVIVNTNIASMMHHKIYFNSIIDYLLSSYTIQVIDRSGCNIARGCFLPHDANVYCNPSSMVYRLTNNDIEQLSVSQYVAKLSKSTKHDVDINAEYTTDDILNKYIELVRKRTEMGLYANIFNLYRYKAIESDAEELMYTYVPVIISLWGKPYKLDWVTRLSEAYFKGRTDRPIAIDGIDGLNGLEVCQINLKSGNVIREHYRRKTLSAMSMKLIFNNPFCCLDRLVKEINWINETYCANPLSNPKPTPEQIKSIVKANYYRFLEGELDFSGVIRKKSKKDIVSKKFVFWSREYVNLDHSDTQRKAIIAYHATKNRRTANLLSSAITVLQDGSKLTLKRISMQMNVSSKTISRHMTDELKITIKRYNDNLSTPLKLTG